MLTLSPKNTQEAIIRTIKAGEVPYVQSSPGVGKSMIVEAVTKQFNLLLIDFRLAAADPTDLQGFPSKTDNNRMGYLPPEDFPLVGDPIPTNPEGVPYNGWLLFFDELPQAFPSIQNASYKIFLDKKIGQRSIHPNVCMVAAGNLSTDKAHTHKLSTALQSRLVALSMVVSNDDWDDWAIEDGIDYRIRAFIKHKPELLHNMDKLIKAKADISAYACPRSWAKGSAMIIDSPNELDVIDRALLEGAVGQGAAMEFAGFCELFDKLIDYSDILKDPDNVPVPSEPSVLHALAGLLSHPKHLATLPKIMPFIDRLPVEFQVYSLRDAIKLQPALLNNPALTNWKHKYIDRLVR